MTKVNNLVYNRIRVESRDTMKIITKKNIYLLSVFVVSLLLLVIVPTYAKFPSSYTASDNMVGFVLDFNVSITDIEEYEEIVIEPHSYEKFNVKITNNLGHDAFYGVWYRMVEPSAINSDIQVGKLYGTSVNTSGSIKSGVDTTVTLIIRNDTSNQVKVDVGIATSATSVNDIEYLNGKKLISDTLNLLLREVEVGSYVKYTGNNGCSGKACEGQNANYVDSSNMGYCFGEQFIVNGWRLGYVSDNTAYLVSAGAPECYGTPSGAASYAENIGSTIYADSVFEKEQPLNLYPNYSFNAENGKFSLSGTVENIIFIPGDAYSHLDNLYICEDGTSITCSKMYATRISGGVMSLTSYTSTKSNGAASAEIHITNLNNASLKYCNSTYAYGGKCNSDSTWSMSGTDFEKITSNTLEACYLKPNSTDCGYGNDLVDNGSWYWYANSKTTTNTYIWIGDYRHAISSVGSSVLYGLRPILRIKSSVYIAGGSGTVADPYVISV